MNAIEINAKVQYLLNSVNLSTNQKEVLTDVLNSLIKEVERVSDNSETETDYSSVTTTTLGSACKVESVELLEPDSTLDDVIVTINTLISNLKSSDLMAAN